MDEYGFLDRLLHRAALQLVPLAELSFELDQRLSGPVFPELVAERHVFVSGLARGGTTILMRRIHATGAFCSLTYRNMPFVLAPRLWHHLAKVSIRKARPMERPHRDRILVDADSPESLDEVFWRIFEGDKYIADNRLKPHVPEDGTLEKYIAYVNAILSADSAHRKRYLSKNNNNVLRLASIRRAFPGAVILVPFREPLSHANSLLRQHLNFLGRQRQDAFIRSYMTWLGHHEFGLDHRPFWFSDDGARRRDIHEAECIDYWLEIWRETYAWLESSAPEDAVFVCYEDLCQRAEVWKHLAELCEIDPGDGNQERFIISTVDVDAQAQPTLIEEASAIYTRLRRRAWTSLEGQ